MTPSIAPLQEQAKRSRSLFWPGFVLGFLLLTLITGAALFVLLGLNRIDFAELRGSADVWQPPEVTATPVAAQAPPGSQAEADALFAPGDQADNVTSTRVNIRRAPGYLGKPAGDILAQALPGERVEIVGDRTVADNLIWWRIRYIAPDGRTVEGWMAESTASGVQIMAPPR